jgi:hypothetical protein
MSSFPLPETGARRWLFAALVAMLVAGCASGPRYGPDSPVTTIVVSPPRFDYAPLVPQTIARVGLYISPELRSAAANSGGGKNPRARFEIGDAVTVLVDKMVRSMFRESVPIQELPDHNHPANGVDLVVAPRIDSNSYDFSMEFEVREPAGNPIAKVASRALRMPQIDERREASTAIVAGLAAEELKTAVAQASVRVLKSPPLREWLSERKLAFVWSEPAATVDAATPTGVTIVRCSQMAVCNVTGAPASWGKRCTRSTRRAVS